MNPYHIGPYDFDPNRTPDSVQGCNATWELPDHSTESLGLSHTRWRGPSVPVWYRQVDLLFIMEAGSGVIVIGDRLQAATKGDLIPIARSQAFAVVPSTPELRAYVASGPSLVAAEDAEVQMVPAVDGRHGWSDDAWLVALKECGFELGVVLDPTEPATPESLHHDCLRWVAALSRTVATA
jgi:hypothetical protein